MPFSKSNAHQGVTLGNYYLDNDTWNSKFDGSQTISYCSPSNWSVTTNVGGSNGTEVLAYPNVHEDFNNNPAISSLSSNTSSFAEQGPEVGDYEYAYDLLLNDQNYEVMIWTDNHGQTPGGDKKGTFTSGGQTYTVWSDDGYTAFVDNTNVKSGTVNLLDFYKYLIQQGSIASTSTITQEDYGIEICNTGGSAATYKVSNFSIATQ